jgi:hypothetical protein
MKLVNDIFSDKRYFPLNNPTNVEVEEILGIIIDNKK